MEIENHKEEVPFEHYLEKYKSLDPKEAAQRLNIVYDETEQKFSIRFMGHPYEVHFPEFEIKALDEEEKDGLLMTSLPAETFIFTVSAGRAVCTVQWKVHDLPRGSNLWRTVYSAFYGKMY